MNLLVITDAALIIGALISLVGSVTAGALSYHSNKNANQTNIDLTRETNEWNRQQVLDQREYDSPANYMQRLAQAGLNPNLAYGSSSSSSVASGSAPEVSPMDYSAFASSGSDIMNGVLQNRQLDIEQQRVNQEGKQVEGTVKYQDAAIINFGHKNKLDDANAALAQQKVTNLGKEIEVMNAQIQKNQAMIDNMNEDTRLKAVERTIAEIKSKYTASEMESKINNLDADTKRLLSERNLNAQKLNEWVQTFELRKAGLSLDNAYKSALIDKTFAETNNAMAELTGINLNNQRLSIAIDIDKMKDWKIQEIRGQTGDPYWNNTFGGLLRSIDNLFSVLPLKGGFSLN